MASRAPNASRRASRQRERSRLTLPRCGCRSSGNASRGRGAKSASRTTKVGAGVATAHGASPLSAGGVDAANAGSRGARRGDKSSSTCASAFVMAASAMLVDVGAAPWPGVCNSLSVFASGRSSCLERSSAAIDSWRRASSTAARVLASAAWPIVVRDTRIRGSGVGAFSSGGGTALLFGAVAAGGALASVVLGATTAAAYKVEPSSPRVMSRRRVEGSTSGRSWLSGSSVMVRDCQAAQPAFSSESAVQAARHCGLAAGWGHWRRRASSCVIKSPNLESVGHAVRHARSQCSRAAHA
mmetsp:Transcript_26190/g.72142  ORF Transcript_26190/g.72142 Transcript_26190/m.72142 type:complete len:298 (+) Transcript_26190:2289-3182(+)